MTNSPLAGASARPLAAACPQQTATAIITAAHDLLGHLAAGRRIDTPAIRTAIQSAFGASDATGAWDWKTAYEAVEVAQLLFMRRYGPAIHARTADPFERLTLVERIGRLAPTQTRRSEEMQAYQQFSTPLGLAWVTGFAAGFLPGELVLEPSAGTGLLAVQAEFAGCRLAVNEVAEVRAALLGSLFAGSHVSMHDAAQIHDRLDASLVPSCIIMNPPFSAALNVEARVADAAIRHLSSAVARLADGGRLVAITGANCAPDHKAWRDGFVRMQDNARVVFSASIVGSVFAPHGTTVETRLTVIDKVPADDAAQFPASPGIAPDLATLLRWLAERTLTGLAVLLQSQALKQALAPYCIGGPFGRLLDAESEHLGEASFQAFETEGLTGSAAAPAVLSYLFHRIEGRLDGSPTMIMIDEGWLVLDSPAFAAQLREWLKTLRKKNASVVFATQSLADIETSAIAPAIIESCPTRIFLPNERAVEPQILAIYRRFGLNDRQIEIIARAKPKRDYYCQSARGNRLFELGLGEVALAFTATSSKADQLAIDAITGVHGTADFAARWLRHRGLAWAAELLPAPSPLPQPGPQPGPLPDQPQE